MAVDYYLKLDGIEGESADANYKKQIQILSWNWGASNISSVGLNGGSGAGKVNLGDFSVTTFFDKATPRFFRSTCEGKHIPSGTMFAIKAGAPGGKPYLKVDFGQMFVTAIQMNADKEIPTVSLSFSYADITIDYGIQDAAGNVTSIGPVKYSLPENKAE